MAGNQNSGRGSWDKQRQARRLWNLSIPVLVHYLTSSKVSQAKKVEVALSLVNKMIPVEFKGSGFAPEVKVFVQNIINRAGVNDAKREVDQSSIQSENRLN